jgi:hypothetical protein
MGEQFPTVLFNCLQGQFSSSDVFHGNKLSDTLKSPSSPGLHGAPLQAAFEFLLLALNCRSSQSTTARLIGDVHVSVLKMFHPTSDIAGTHAGISIHTTKSLADDSCRLSLFNKKFGDNTLTTKYNVDNHFLVVHDWNIRGTHALILRSYWRGKMPLMVLKCSLQYSRPILCNLVVLITFGKMYVLYQCPFYSVMTLV